MTNNHIEPLNANIHTKVIIGVPVNAKSGYIIEKFLQNQKEIQERSQETITVFATEDIEFAQRLDILSKSYKISYEILNFEIKRPINTNDRIWNIVSARNAIRDFFLKSNADYLVFMDADMIFDPEIVNKLVKIAEKGYDVVYNGYSNKSVQKRINLTGFGGTLLKWWVMEKIKFRCKERNGRVIDEGVFLEVDLVRIGAKVYRGFVSYCEHYDENKVTPTITMPRELTLNERIGNNIYFRSFFHIFSIALSFDVLRFVYGKIK